MSIITYFKCVADCSILSRNDETLEERLMNSNQGYHLHCDLPNRETELRVCVSIHEARNLEGVDCNPVVRVACRCGQKIKKTRSCKGSVNPKFSEVSSINYYLIR